MLVCSLCEEKYIKIKVGEMFIKEKSFGHEPHLHKDFACLCVSTSSVSNVTEDFIHLISQGSLLAQ